MRTTGVKVARLLSQFGFKFDPGSFSALISISALLIAMSCASLFASAGIAIVFTGMLSVALAEVALRSLRNTEQERRHDFSSYLEQQVRYGKQIVIRDPQTTLLQRWYFELRVHEEIDRCKRYGNQMA